MNIQIVKRELRELKSTVHIIDTLKATQQKYRERIVALRRLSNSPRVDSQIKNLERVLGLMCIDEYVKRATELEEKYIIAINQLDPLEKTIILDSFINGIPYWKIGLSLGYADETIRKKVSRAIRKIALSLK